MQCGTLQSVSSVPVPGVRHVWAAVVVLVVLAVVYVLAASSPCHPLVALAHTPEDKTTQ